ncbi:MAG TPA: dihydrofolate reductase family protein [Roseiarcus sp.]
MAQLASVFGVKKLLLEGGGKINGAFLKHRLIDEFSTLIYPAVDGVAGAQSIVDYDSANGERPGVGQALRLIGCEDSGRRHGLAAPLCRRDAGARPLRLTGEAPLS